MEKFDIQDFLIKNNLKQSEFILKAFAWAANAFDVCCYLTNNSYTEGYLPPDFEALIAVGVDNEIITQTPENAFEELKNFRKEQSGWLFGFLSYDLKNDVEKLDSQNFDGLEFPEMYFFKPLLILKITAQHIFFIKNKSTISSDKILKEIEKKHLPDDNQALNLKINSRFSKAEYLTTVSHIKQHIARGDIFEMNFCQEFYAIDTHIDPLSIFIRLNDLARAPFSSFFKLKDKYVMCASPERFIKKTGNLLVSQPIKGTSRRGTTEGEDILLKKQLYNDPKNRSENVMIVDLVRNDLGKSCEAGTVKVTELYGIYSFPTVHQMISTVEGRLKNSVHFVDALKNTFPMGSMTGAPKVRAMQLIEQYERTKRGVYSGAIGYISPENDFDFNVVIRSILYNAEKRYLSFQVGGAIVFDSDPEAEYEECLVKTKAIFSILSNKKH